MKLSVVVPFYKGNNYLERLLTSIEKAVVFSEIDADVVIVNDSPEIDVKLPSTKLTVTVITNERNLGIQGSRINGIIHAPGDWILMIDQDDEIVSEGFKRQLELTKNADVVVGNGTYILGDVKKKIFKNLKCMNYLIRKKRFIEIRNLIPSPGECLIRKEIIPETWLKNRLANNGSDDWMLWLLLFQNNARFACNELPVYIHNDTGGGNLSADLGKMRVSSIEMADILKNSNLFTDEELKRLTDAIDFKYLQDTHQLGIRWIWRYRRTIFYNVKYKLSVKIRF